jgi:precorrin-6A/cobalt-precorrin-6A reductase
VTILILGGTAEARQLAAALVANGVDVISSLAGRVRAPSLPPGRVRVGGFGGVHGLADYLRHEHASAMVDATHPFATMISHNAQQAAALSKTPLVRLERPGWRQHPRSDSWTWVADVAAARAAAESALRPFLTTGRQSLPAFLTWADRNVLVRLVDPPTDPLPERWVLIMSRGPYSYAGERQILTGHAIDVLVTKDSGGAHTVAKLDAASDLSIPVVILARPKRALVTQLETVSEAVAWCRCLDVGDAPRRVNRACDPLTSSSLGD